MDFTQSMDNGYMIPASVAIGSGEATDIRCVCDTVEDFKAFLDTTGMELRYEGLVTYEKVNKLLKVYKGNNIWQTVGEGGGNVDTSSFITLTQLSQQLGNYYTKSQTDSKILEEIAKAQVGGSYSAQSIITSRKWLVIGDSITTHTNHSTKNYFDFIADRTRCSISNWGRDGYTIVRYVEEEQVAQMPTDVDFVSVLLGTNDWHIGAKSLGNFLDTSSETVAGAFNILLQQLIQKYGDRTIVVFTPLQRNGYGGNQSGLNASNNSKGFNLLALVDIIIKTCSHYGIPCKDLYRESGFHMQYDISNKLYFTDGLHPNLKGHEALSYIMQPFIENNYKPNPNAIPQTYGEIVVSKDSATIVEGATDTFNVKLSSEPSQNQIVYINKDNDDIILSSDLLTFTPSNFDTVQTVTVSVAEDSDFSNETCNLTLLSPNVSSKEVIINIIDNDEPSNIIPVTSVGLDKTEHTLKVDETVQLVATVQPVDATDKSVVWSSSDTSKATVTTSGLVTARGKGVATITVTSRDGNKIATCNLTIESNIEDLVEYDVKVIGYGDFTPDQVEKTCIIRDNNSSWNNGGVACNDALIAGNTYNICIEVLELDIKDNLKTSASSASGIWSNLNTSDWATWIKAASVGSKKIYTGTLAKNINASSSLLVIYFEGSNSGSSLKVKFSITDA